MARVVWIAVMAVAAGILPHAAAQPLADEIAKVHQEAKAMIDPELPKKVDGVTVLTGVRTQASPSPTNIE